jgi:DNA-binding MarR family transcriptional regulator
VKVVRRDAGSQTDAIANKERTLSKVMTDKSATAPSAVAWLSEAEQSVWRALLCAEARLNERLDRELRDAHGLSMAEYAVLVHLSEGPPDGIRMSDLAGRLLLSRSGLTRRVDSMVRAGLLTRRSCPADGRGLMAQMTASGRRLLEQAAPTHVAGVRRYLIDVMADRLGALAEGLAQIEAALDEGSPSVGAWAPGVRSGRRAGSPEGHSGCSPETTRPPRSIQPLVPPATETAG